MTEVEKYRIEVKDPNAPGPEHLLMLHRRDGIAEHHEQLSTEERALLREADECLLRNAVVFHKALADCTDMAWQRREQNISPERWWWYLDVLAHLPQPQATDVAVETARAAAS